MTNGMLDGVRLVVSGNASASGFIECSSGIANACSQYRELPYWEGAYVPKLPWNSIWDEDRRRFCSSLQEIGYGNWIQLFKFPQTLYDAFKMLREASVSAHDEGSLNPLRSTPECQEAVKQALQFANTLVYPSTTVGGGNIYFNAPGLPTTSHYREPLLLGIHTDTLCHVPLDHRRFSPNRLCLNCGSDERYFLYVNLTLTQIERLLREHGIDYSERPHTPPLQAFRVAFMSNFQDYPVMKVRIRPGEGYLAPTENVIHDGCSVGQSAFDMPFHAYGHFRPYC